MNPSIPKCQKCGNPGSFQDKDGAFCARHWSKKEDRVERVRRSRMLRWLCRVFKLEM